MISAHGEQTFIAHFDALMIILGTKQWHLHSDGDLEEFTASREDLAMLC